MLMSSNPEIHDFRKKSHAPFFMELSGVLHIGHCDSLLYLVFETANISTLECKMTPKKKNKKLLNFQNAHKLRCRLKVRGINPDTKEVTFSACRFCLKFGREEKFGAQRKPAERVKYFERFRTDNFTQHLTMEHNQNRTQYRMLKLDSDRGIYPESWSSISQYRWVSLWEARKFVFRE